MKGRSITEISLVKQDIKGYDHTENKFKHTHTVLFRIHTQWTDLLASPLVHHICNLKQYYYSNIGYIISNR